MLLLGLLFIIAAGAVTAGVIYDGGEDATVELFGTTVDTTIAGVFGVGLLCGLLFLLGIWLIVAGGARSRRKRLERKAARARHRDSVAQMEQERAQLRAENQELQERLAREGGTTGTAPAAGTGEPGVARPERPSDAGNPTGTAPRADTGTQSWRPDEPGTSRYDDSGRDSGHVIDTEASRRREGV
jgi:hypothetical protein